MHKLKKLIIHATEIKEEEEEEGKKKTKKEIRWKKIKL